MVAYSTVDCCRKYPVRTLKNISLWIFGIYLKMVTLKTKQKEPKINQTKQHSVGFLRSYFCKNVLYIFTCIIASYCSFAVCYFVFSPHTSQKIDLESIAFVYVTSRVAVLFSNILSSFAERIKFEEKTEQRK